MRLDYRTIFAGLLIILGSGLSADAQGFRRPDPDQIFGFMDRNGNGRLEPDEIENSRGPMKERLQQAGVDYSRGLDKDDFVRTMEQARAEEGESESGGRGDFGGRGFGDRGDDGGSRGGWGDRGSWGDRGRGDDRSSGGDRGRGDDRGSSRGGPQPAPKVTVRIPLQNEFVIGDLNQDGQITFAEWRDWKGRGLLNEFKQFDLNSDGFITPAEILRAGQMPPEAAAPAIAATNSPPAQTADDEREARGREDESGSDRDQVRPTSGKTTVPSIATAQPAATDSTPINDSDPNTRRYRSYFKLLDRNSDGKVDLSEWEKGENTRRKFNDAGIKIEEMDSDAFIRGFMRVDANGRS
ncbi:MAG: hypothetical protein R3B90_20380 [Planctomycetaceae bacterium]